MTGPLSDLRYAARALLARPSFTAAAVLTLVIGIGLSTAVFGVVDAVVLRQLPLPHAGQLITLCEQYPGATADWCSISPPNAVEISERSRSLAAMGIGRSWSFTMPTVEGARNVSGGLASAGMFEALGIRAEQGRLIQPTDLIGRPSLVAVISHEMWVKDFGAARDIVGRSIVLDSNRVTIVGVLQPAARVPMLPQIDVWRPLYFNPRDERNREWRGFVAYARLRDGVSIGAARLELKSIASDLRGRYFRATAGWDITPRSLRDLIVGNVRQPMLLFFGAVLLVLLIACANVANLLLTHGAGRAREMAIRTALGANRRDIVRSLLCESFLIALAGTLVATLAADWATQAFKAMAPADIPRLSQIGTNATVLAFAALLLVATTVLFGLLPALRVSRGDLAQSLREGGRTASRAGSGLGRALVIGEMAVAMPLVVGAMLLARSFSAQVQWQPGFERDHLLAFSLFLPNNAYKQSADIGGTWDRLEPEIKSVPGVTSVGTASAGPLFGGRETWQMDIEGWPSAARLSVRWYDVSPGFFQTLGVPLVRGRDFDATDTYGAPSSGLINETLARRAWPGQSPIGKHIIFRVGKESETFTVKGVVRDVPPLRPGPPVEPELYWSNRQQPRPFTYFLVRTTVPPARVEAAIRDRVAQVNRDFVPGTMTTMSELVGDQVRAPRFSMTLLIAFGAAALILAAIGSYGLLAYLVQQRRKEIGIRLALGAQRDRVLGDVVRRGLGLAVPGIALGMAGSLVITRLIRTYVAGVSPFDPLSLVASALVVLLAAVTASIVPAWRASRVDPAVTLVAE